MQPHRERLIDWPEEQAREVQLSSAYIPRPKSLRQTLQREARYRVAQLSCRLRSFQRYVKVCVSQRRELATTKNLCQRTDFTFSMITFYKTCCSSWHFPMSITA